MTDYGFFHNGRVFTPNATPVTLSDLASHNDVIERNELVFLASQPERFTAYVGAKLGDGMGCDRYGGTSRRRLLTWRGVQIGTCALSSSWLVRSHIGPRMWQIYATMNGVEYTGRGFGAGMVVNLRRIRRPATPS